MCRMNDAVSEQENSRIVVFELRLAVTTSTVRHYN